MPAATSKHTVFRQLIGVITLQRHSWQAEGRGAAVVVLLHLLQLWPAKLGIKHFQMIHHVQSMQMLGCTGVCNRKYRSSAMRICTWGRCSEHGTQLMAGHNFFEDASFSFCAFHTLGCRSGCCNLVCVSESRKRRKM